MGIKLRFASQISEHCPKNNLGRLIRNLIWLSRPRVASALTPNLGIVHEFNTSVAVIIIRINVFIGRAVRYTYYKVVCTVHLI